MLPVQCKMARAALGLGVPELAAKAGVSPDTVLRLEKGETLHRRTVIAIHEALEEAGIEFLPDGGVQLKGRRGSEIQKTNRRESRHCGRRRAGHALVRP